MTIIIIDDDHLVVNSLATIITASNIKVLGVGYSGHDAISLFKEYIPDIVLMDIRMDKMNGIQATKEILEIDPNAKILLITTFEDEEYITSALAIGCKGYILKQNIGGIIPAINAVYSNNLVFDSKIVSNIKRTPKKSPATNLTDRENEILLLVAKGLNNKEIAEQLFLSQGTIRNYISELLSKLNLRDRTQLAIYYYNEKYEMDENNIS